MELGRNPLLQMASSVFIGVYLWLFILSQSYCKPSSTPLLRATRWIGKSVCSGWAGIRSIFCSPCAEQKSQIKAASAWGHASWAMVVSMYKSISPPKASSSRREPNSQTRASAPKCWRHSLTINARASVFNRILVPPSRIVRAGRESWLVSSPPVVWRPILRLATPPDR